MILSAFFIVGMFPLLRCEVNYKREFSIIADGIFMVDRIVRSSVDGCLGAFFIHPVGRVLWLLLDSRVSL